MMKQVMKRAWEIAKAGVAKFGGKVREYFAASLALAWKEIKAMTNKAVDLVGSPKQIAWASDIRVKLVKYLENVLNSVTEVDREWFDDKEELMESRDLIKKLIGAACEETSAKFFIENRETTSLLEALSEKYDILYAFGAILDCYDDSTQKEEQ